MKACLAISLLFHFFLLMGFQKAFPSFWDTRELKTYNVEIIRPPTEDLDSEDLQGPGGDSLNREKDDPAEASEDTISLDTKDERYVQYTEAIKMKIAGHWDYPAEARLNLLEGEVMALFSIIRDGSVVRIDIEKGSGYDILDREVLRAIRASVPFPSFPGTIKVNRLNIKARFDYRLSTGDKSR
ncbi:MAG: energy transducer TonB [Deltaproteobacteria bacterium]|nr:energy transducer TonB [Deltaproteobacteria bacterium]